MSDREEIKARLRNWGRWARERQPYLMAVNGIWGGSKARLWVPNSDDAMVVEYAISSLCQPPSAGEWRRTADVLVAYYVKRGRPVDKARDLGMSERTLFRWLASAEKFLDGILPSMLASDS